jgi:isoquinoline 1-oxidoreductase beta subunit
MEPMNVTVHARSGEAEVWAPSQSPDWVQRAVAEILGLPPAKVAVHTTLMGGGFGRRYMADFPAEAAQVAKVVGKPVQLVWTREDDMTHDFYRPACCHHMRGAVDGNGRPSAWYHILVSTAIRGFWDPSADPASQEVGGAKEMPYAIPNVRLEYSPVASSVPRAWWRSVENSFNGFAVESFIDELAAAAGQDPVKFRRSLLAKPANWKPKSDDDPDPARLRGVLDLAAEKSGWSKPLPKGKGRGIAAFASFGSYFAEVAEVSIVDGKSFKIDRMVAAVDCGRVMNKGVAAQQIEAGLIWALAQATVTAPEWVAGMPRARPIGGMGLPRLADAPDIVVEIIPSSDAPGGISGLGTTVLAPAVANAIHAGSGKRMRNLPFEVA